ncbi:MAG: LysM peptidoglycan-binding domain-containing protein [Elusimicrobiota bacterium]|nr:LysM peptidoglycan-binding domain-containing protein [Elusimicrobiota bacterium]
MRTCGECRECCKVFPLPALDKPAGVWCRLLGPVGCTVHDLGQPEVCSRYACWWLEHEGLPEEARPDRIGLVVTESGTVPVDGYRLPVLVINLANPDSDRGPAAKAAGVELTEIQRLNPQVRNWATQPNRPGFLFRVPKGSRDIFRARLAEVADWNPGPSLLRYTVRKGDVLGKIASRHRTTVRAILALNDIRNPRQLRPGMVLKLEPGRGRQP